MYLKIRDFDIEQTGNPECREPSVRDVALREQLLGYLKNLKLPSLHRLWMERHVARLNVKNDEVMSIIQKQLCETKPDIQRQIVAALFQEMTLKEKLLSVVPRIPFSIISQVDN